MSFLGLGGSTPQVNFTPSGFNNPTGFSVSGKGNVSQSAGLSSNIGSLQSAFGQQAGALGALGRTVAPGFSQFRMAGLRDIANQFRSARSNLQDTLAQRRILGSSFANSQFSQQAADEAQAKANFAAQSYIQELQASYQLTQAQYQAQTQGYQAAINQSNIESSTAASLVASNNATAAQIATANAQLQAQAQAGAGNFMGTLLGIGANSLGRFGAFGSGGALSGLFGGAGAGVDFAGGTAALGSSIDEIGALLPLALA